MRSSDHYQGLCIPWSYLSPGLWEAFAAFIAAMFTMAAVSPHLVQIQAALAGVLVGAAVRGLIALTLRHRDRQPVHMNAARALLYAEQLIDFAADFKFLGAATRAGKLRRCSQDLLARVQEDPSASSRQRSRATRLLNMIRVDDGDRRTPVHPQPTSMVPVAESRGA